MDAGWRCPPFGEQFVGPQEDRRSLEAEASKRLLVAVPLVEQHEMDPRGGRRRPQQLLGTPGSTNTSSCGLIRHGGRSQRAIPQSTGDRPKQRSLLIDEVRIVDLLQARLVSVAEHSPEFRPGLIDPTGQNQCRIAQVNEGHLAAILDSPPMPQLSREAGLTTMRNLCLHH